MKKLFSTLLTLIILSCIVFPQNTKPGGRVTIGGKTNIVTTVITTEFVSDSFTETSDTELSLHTGEIGATWTHHPDGNYTGNNFSVIGSTDRIFSDGLSAYYASGVPTNANYEVECEFFVASFISQNVACSGRLDTTNDTQYILRLNGNTSWDVRKIVGGAAGVTILTTSSNIPSVGGTSVCKLMMNVDQISASIDSGAVILGPVTDTAITAAGRVGVRNSGIAGASTGIHINYIKARPL